MIHEYQFSIDSIDAANKATHTTYAEDSSWFWLCPQFLRRQHR